MRFGLLEDRGVCRGSPYRQPAHEVKLVPSCPSAWPGERTDSRVSFVLLSLFRHSHFRPPSSKFGGRSKTFRLQPAPVLPVPRPVPPLPSLRRYPRGVPSLSVTTVFRLPGPDRLASRPHSYFRPPPFPSCHPLLPPSSPR